MANAVDPVVIEFALKGLPAVFRAFEQLSKVAAKAESEWARASTSGAQTRMRALLTETQQKTRIAGRSASETERALAREEKAAERAARAKIREADKAAKEAVRIEARKAKEVERILQRQRRDEKRLVDESMREAEKAAKARAAIAKREGAETWRATQGVGRGMANTARRVMGMGMGVARGVMDVGGGFSVKDSIQREVDARGAAAQIAAGTVKSGRDAGITGAEILRAAKETSVSAVMDQADVVSAIGAFKDKTGSARRGMSMVGDMAKLANATGADLTQLMTAAGAVAAGNDKMGDSEIKALLSVYAKQGQLGSVEVKDLAKYGGRLVAGAGLFEGGQSKNLGTMGAFAQLAAQKGGAASPAEAAMAAQRFATDVQKKAADIEASGIKVKGKGGLMRDPTAIMMDMVRKSGGDVTKLSQMGLGDRGIRVLTGAARMYSEAGGGAAGEKAINEFLASMTKGTSQAEIDAANKERLAEVDKQLEQAMNSLRVSVGEALLPALQQLIPVVREVTPQLVALMSKFGELVAWASKNPFSTLVAAMTASLVMEIGKANIAATIKSLIAGGGGAGGAPGLGAGGALGGVVGALGAGVAAGAATAALYTPIASAFGEQDGSKQRLIAGLQNGEITPEQARAQIATAKSRTGAVGMLKSALAVNMGGMSTAASLLTGKNESANTIRQMMGAKELVDSESVAKAITRAIERGANAANGGGQNPNRSAPINAPSRGGAP